MVCSRNIFPFEGSVVSRAPRLSPRRWSPPREFESCNCVTMKIGSRPRSSFMAAPSLSLGALLAQCSCSARQCCCLICLAAAQLLLCTLRCPNAFGLEHRVLHAPTFCCTRCCRADRTTFFHALQSRRPCSTTCPQGHRPLTATGGDGHIRDKSSTGSQQLLLSRALGS